jgi:hypothetical protein
MADNVAITAGAGTTVGTDERTINAVAVQIQRVNDIGGSTLANGQVNISNAAATLLAARDTRKRVTFVNRMPVAVFIGIATVTTANGFQLDPGASITLHTTALIQGITAAATAGTVYVHYIEEYDS